MWKRAQIGGAKPRIHYTGGILAMNWDHLDRQMRRWGPRLRDDLRISPAASDALATAIFREVGGLPLETLALLRSATPVPVKARIDELIAFQQFMDQDPSDPVSTRAKVIVQNYFSFVYLGDACFRILGKGAPVGSTVRACSRFLIDRDVRWFRNAVAHGNWTYNDDFSGLLFWARKGDDLSEPLSPFEVSQNELDFWQSLARCTAYATFVALGA